MQHITRIKERYKRRVPGYIVRMCYEDGVPKISKEFPLRKYNGKWSEALAAAEKYRDKKISQLEKKDWYFRRRNSRKPMKCNKTGLLGVQRCKQVGGNRRWNGKYCWRTWWIDPKTRKVKTASFSENKYGAYAASLRALMCHIKRRNIYKEDKNEDSNDM